MKDKPTYEELEKRLEELEAKYAHLKKYEYLDIQVNDTREIQNDLIVENIFNIYDMQKIQDQLASAMNVASMITKPDGTPITKPSNFCGLCKLVRSSEKGRENCSHSDSELGKDLSKPTYRSCLSCGLWDAGVSIVINGKHIANWLIGQFRSESQTEEQVREYAREIEVDETLFIEEFRKIPIMSKEDFEKKAEFLYTMANKLSHAYFNDYLNKLMVVKQNNIHSKLLESEQRLSNIIMLAPYPLCVHAEDGELIVLNKAWQELSGYSQHEVPTMIDWIKKVYDEDPDAIWRDIASTYSITDILDRGEKKIRAKDGRHLVWHFHSAPLGKTNDNRRMLISMASDVTLQKENERELIRSEEQYRKYIDMSPVAILVAGKDARFREANQAACDLIGYTKEEILSLHIPDIDADEDDQNNIKDFIHIRDFGHLHSEKQFIRKDGALVDVDLNAVSLDENHYMAFVYDISERKEMEKLVIKHAEDVQRLNERFTLATDSAKIGVYDYDIPNDVLSWDDNMFHTYGVKKEDFGDNYEAWEKMLHPDDLTDANQKVKDCIAGKNDFETTFRIFRPDGSLRYIKAYAKLKKDNAGKPIKLIGINYDITHQKEMEQDILSSRNILKQILDSIPQAIVWKDRNCTFLGCNQNFSRLTGINSPDEAPGKKAGDLPTVSKEDSFLYVEEDLQVMDSKEPFYHLVRKTNTAIGEIWGDITKIPLTYTDGSVYGILTVFDNITDRVTSEEKLKEALSWAEEANRAKSEFLATMSHEIRTPLNGIIGFADVLKNELPLSELDKGEDIKEYLHVITQCSESLLAIINDVLVLSSLEAGQFNHANEEFSPQATFESIIKIFQFKTDSKGIMLTLDYDNLPATIKGDNLRLKQIMFNIVGNSVKFTDKGKVEIKVSYQDKELVINVKDTGCGIPADKLPRVTEPFYQADQSSVRRQGGTGLGLAIVSRILEKLNGRISIRSKLNEGTEIEIVFPVCGSSSGHHDEIDFKLQEDADISMFEILAIEDDAVNIMYLSKILDMTGCRYNTAGSFSELRSLCTKGINPDLALIDIALPDADGFECLEWLRNQYPGRDIKYIVQTAHVLSEKQEMYEKAGFDAYIGKPYTKDQLLDVIKSLLVNIEIDFDKFI